MARGGRKCVAYGVGVATDSSFEQLMSKNIGCEVHAFDCSLDFENPAVYQKPFVFHQWCIGQEPGDKLYAKGVVRVEAVLPCKNCTSLVKVVSGGNDSGANRADFYLNGVKINFKTSRGLNLVTIDPVNQSVKSTRTYDLWGNPSLANRNLISDLKYMRPDRIVLMALMDTGLEKLDVIAKHYLEGTFGARVMGSEFRESFAYIGRKGAPAAQQRSRDRKLVFKSLRDTMHELQHTHLDILKFDMEGFEWKFFKTEILGKDWRALPEQLLFELHSQGHTSHGMNTFTFGAGFMAVNSLMLSLYDQGYRVTSKEINGGDPTSAEFVVVNIRNFTDRHLHNTSSLIPGQMLGTVPRRFR